MPPVISVIIVDYNSGNRLQKCLKHLKDQSYKNFEVIIVNNGSANYSVHDFETSNLDLDLIHADKNLGFAAGCNLAVKTAKGRWLAFLNPDAYADENWLKEFISATKRYTDVQAFGSTQINADNLNVIDGAGDVYHILGIAYRGYFGWNTRHLPPESEVFASCGAAAFYSAEIFNALGGFDERFFCYGEDVDLGFRLRLAGGRCIQISKAIVEHEGSGVTGRHSDFTIYHGHRNRIWLAYKNTPFWFYWPFLPLHLLANLYLLSRSFKAGITKPYLKALWDGYRGLFKFTADRRTIQSHKQVSYKSLGRAIEWSPLKISKREGKNW